MFKSFTYILLYINTLFTFSQNCYTPTDVFNKNLVSYQNKVYDIKNYIHPGGQRNLLLSVGKPLEEFFNMDEYKFHIKSDLVVKDLHSTYIGNLYDKCNNTIPKDNNLSNYIIINDGNVIYPIITISFFILTFVSILFLNCMGYNYLKENVNLYWFGYYSKDILLFYTIYISWWIILLLLSFLYDDTLSRLGSWISLNIAFTLLPITRNSVWITLLKLSYLKLINIHKLISILCLISVVTKILYIIIVYNHNYLYKNISNIAGTLSSLSILLTSILSFPIIRKNIFELFYYSHRILSILTIIIMSFHYTVCLYYIIPSIFLYLIDIILRIINTRKAIYSKVKVYDFKEHNTSYIFIFLTLLKPIKIKPGCYFFICCDKISNLEWHPLSLVSEKNDNLVFCVKNMKENSWSNNLKKLKDVEYLTNNKNNIYLQGPYYHINFNYNYEYIINIANGIGITPFFSILKEINHNINKNKLVIKKVVLIWIIQEMKFLLPFVDNLKFLNNINIEIYLTKSELENEIQNLNFCKVFNNKPNIFDYIKNFIEENQIQNKKKCCVISCGSDSLIKDVYYTTNNFGIELFNESFN